MCVAQVVWVCGSAGCTPCLMTCGQCWSLRSICGVRLDSVPRTFRTTDITAATQTHGAPHTHTPRLPTHSTGESTRSEREREMRNG